MISSSSECCAIIVTYNGMNWIERCVGSLENSSISVDIVVVDNGSEDGTVQFLEKKSTIKLIKNESNLGFGKANNEGLKYAYSKGYQYFFLLNQDAWIEDATMERLIQTLRENREYGILSPVHLNGEGRQLDPGFGRYMRLRPSSGFYRDHKRNQVLAKVYEVSFVNAAAWIISRRCLEEVGLFHPLFKHYGEDDNYIHRVKSKSFKVGVLGNTRIFHDRVDRFKKRIDPKAKFRSMVLMSHLNPLKQRNAVALWLISMGNLLSILSLGYFLANLRFYWWGIHAYSKIVEELKGHGSKDFNPLKTS